MKNNADLFRYKGVISIKGIKKKIIFYGSHMIFKMDAAEEDWGEVRENRITFIGRNLDKEFLTQAIMKCVVNGNEPLRFKIGEKVECQTDKGW